MNYSFTSLFIYFELQGMEKGKKEENLFGKNGGKIQIEKTGLFFALKIPFECEREGERKGGKREVGFFYLLVFTIGFLYVMRRLTKEKKRIFFYLID